MGSSTSPPESVIIVGAGVFGLSTALAIARRHPSTRVTVVDRLTPPVQDGTSVDTTRCIRSVYADPIYARLAADAQKKIEQDEGLRPHYFKQGMSFVIDGKPGTMLTNWENALATVRAQAPPGASGPTLMNSPEEVFQSIHGKDAKLAPTASLSGQQRKWNLAYRNFEDAFIDAEQSIRVYYERCLTYPSIIFRCGVPVEKLQTAPNDNKTITGVILEDGQSLSADITLVAAGAWSNKLVYLDGLIQSSAIEVAWIKLTEPEMARWKNMSITTNLSTGLNLFPPHNGEVKILRRSPGYKNTVTIAHPEDPDRRVITSLPRTVVTNPGDQIPEEAEKELRANLREIMPEIAEREFDRTKLCWIAQTASSDFIIAPHPRLRGLHVATGGSAHGWKFLPIIGDFILDSMEGKLAPELVAKWAWGVKNTDHGNASRLAGEAKELRDFVRSRL